MSNHGGDEIVFRGSWWSQQIQPVSRDPGSTGSQLLVNSPYHSSDILADGLYPSCAENPAVQGGDVERGERSSPKLNSVSAAARCTGG